MLMDGETDILSDEWMDEPINMVSPLCLRLEKIETKRQYTKQINTSNVTVNESVQKFLNLFRNF